MYFRRADRTRFAGFRPCKFYVPVTFLRGGRNSDTTRPSEASREVLEPHYEQMRFRSCGRGDTLVRNPRNRSSMFAARLRFAVVSGALAVRTIGVVAHARRTQCAASAERPLEKIATCQRVIVIFRNSAIRSESGGCVLNNPENNCPRRERLHDHQRRSGRRHIHRNLLVIGAQFFQGADQSIRMSDHLHAGSVRLIFALPRNPQLQ